MANEGSFELHALGNAIRQQGDVQDYDARDSILTGSAPMSFQPVSNGPACLSMTGAPPRLLAARVLLARRSVWPAIAAAECRYGLPPGLMDSLVLAESHYDPAIVSRAGAAGLAQLMPATARQLGVLDRFDPVASVEAGARYLRSLLTAFSNNVPLALAAYNAGPLAVKRARGIPVNGETSGYVRRVMTYWTAPGIGPLSPQISARQTALMLGFAPPTPN